MGKITEALKKVTDERVTKIQKKPEVQYVVKKAENTDVDQHIVSFHDPSSPIGEQYKILRTNIQSLKYTKGYRTFVITSSINGEGKTVTAINTALTVAQDTNAKSVLLIDADIRKGTVAKYMGLHRSPGLSEVLKGEKTADSVLVNPGIENLTVMPSGKTPKNPSELLNSKKMESLLAVFKNKFDYIFIDTPPIMPLTDACILAPMVSGVILVVQAGRTQRDIIKHAEARLFQARAKVIGYVMTKLEYHLPNYLYKYMHKYDNYHYYSNYEADAKDVKQEQSEAPPKGEKKEVGAAV